MESTLVALLVLLTSSYAIGSDCPLPTPRLVPLGKTLNYTCPCINGTTICVLQMLVTVPPSTAPIAVTSPNDLLKSRGVERVADDAILFHANTSNNNTLISCTYLQSSILQVVCMSSVVMNVYGIPQRPQLLQVRSQAAPEGNLFFNVTWAPPYNTPQGVDVFYVVLVVNLSASLQNATSTGPIRDFFYIFPYPARPTTCYPYQFTVLAENAAGRSESSNPIVARVTLAPRFKEVEMIISNVHEVTVHLMEFEDCLDSNVSYYVQFKSNLTKSQEEFGPYFSTDRSLYLTLGTLERLHSNEIYTCFVVATNIAGNTTSPSFVMYTTDVQSSTIIGSDHQLNVTCFFAEDTQARGCVVRLERSGGVVYQMIPRVNETAEGVVITEFSVDCYNISVVDWEEDGSIGSVAIPMKLRRTSLMAFIMCNNDTQSNEGTWLIVAISVAPSVALVALLVTAALLAVFVRLFRQGVCFATSVKPKLKDQSQVSCKCNGDKGDYSEPTQPAAYDNILINVIKMQKPSPGSHYNFLQRFVLPHLYPQPSHVHVYEEQDLNYNHLFKEQQAKPSPQPYSYAAHMYNETPYASAGTNL